MPSSLKRVPEGRVMYLTVTSFLWKEGDGLDHGGWLVLLLLVHTCRCSCWLLVGYCTGSSMQAIGKAYTISGSGKYFLLPLIAGCT